MTIQHSDNEEEIVTINAEEKQEETTKTIEQKRDADLHQFSFDGQKFFVRLNQFVSIVVYLRKLYHPISRSLIRVFNIIEWDQSHTRLFEKVV